MSHVSHVPTILLTLFRACKTSMHDVVSLAPGIGMLRASAQVKSLRVCVRVGGCLCDCERVLLCVCYYVDVGGGLLCLGQVR